MKDEHFILLTILGRVSVCAENSRVVILSQRRRISQDLSYEILRFAQNDRLVLDRTTSMKLRHYPKAGVRSEESFDVRSANLRFTIASRCPLRSEFRLRNSEFQKVAASLPTLEPAYRSARTSKAQ